MAQKETPNPLKIEGQGSWSAEGTFLSSRMQMLELYNMCVMISITSNLDKVQSNSLIVPCASNTSEFQDVSVREFQFDENWKQGGMPMIVAQT